MAECEKPSFRLGPDVGQEDVRTVNQSTGRGRGQEVVPFSMWNRLAESVVLIKTKGPGNGTGFLSTHNNNIVLCTSNHVLMDKETALSAEIVFDLGDSMQEGKSITGDELFDMETAFHHSPDEDLDYTMIAVRKDQLQSLLKRELEPLKWAVLDLKRKDALYIMHHPELEGGQQPKCFNCYLVQNTQAYYIYYKTSTEKGSSGAPLIKVAGVNAQPFVVGIHKGTIMARRHRTANYGVMFETVMNHASGILPKTKVGKALVFKTIERTGPHATYEVVEGDIPPSETPPLSDDPESDEIGDNSLEVGDEKRLNAKPTELQLRHHVVQKVPPSEWKAFCSYLGLSATEIDYCEADYKTVSEQFHRALLKWHQGKGRERIWHSILTAFSSVGLADAEEELRKCILDDKLIK